MAISSPIAGNHYDLYQIENHLDELFQTLEKANIATDGLFVNADAGFDSKEFRNKCLKYGIIANTAINPRNGNSEDDILFDEILYEQRYTIERTNAWIDSYRTLVNRFETTISSWLAFNYIVLITIFLKKIYKNKKSR